MSLGSEMIEVTVELLAEYGRTITYNSIVAGAYDPATSSFAITTTPYQIKALVEEEKDKGKSGSLDQDSRRKMTIAADGLLFSPALTDTVTTGSKTYAVNDIDSVWVGDVPVLYVFELRKG